MPLADRIVALPPAQREPAVQALWTALADSEYGELLYDYIHGVLPGYLAVLMDPRATDAQRSFYSGALSAINDFKTRLALASTPAALPPVAGAPPADDLTSEDDDQPSDLYNLDDE